MKVSTPDSDTYMPLMDTMDSCHPKPPFMEISPERWTVPEVKTFVTWCCEEYDIQHVDMKKFHINGKGLCLLTRENFCERIPDVGDVVFNKLLSLRGLYTQASTSPAPLNLSRDGNMSPRSRDTGSSVSSATPPAVIINPCMSPISSASASNLSLNDGEQTPLNLSKSPDMFSSKSPLVTSDEDSMNYLQRVIYPGNGYTLQAGDYVPVPVCHVKLEPRSPYSDGYENSYQFVMPPSNAIITDSPLCLSKLHNSDEPLDLNTKHSSSTFNRSPIDHMRHYIGRTGSTDGYHPAMYSGSYPDSSSDKGEESNEIPSLSSSPCQESSVSTASPVESTNSNIKNGKNGESDSKLLWEFINKLLAEPEEFSHLVRWEDKERRVFRIVNTGSLATLWGQQKNRTTMTYEKLSRSLRYYYKMNIISKEPGRRLTYRFMKPPTDIPKGQRGAKPGVPHRPRGWRQKMKEEQRARRAREATIARMRKEGADPEAIAAFLAENSLNVPPSCEGHPIKDTLTRTHGDPSRQPCFPDLMSEVSPIKLETAESSTSSPEPSPIKCDINGNVKYENNGIYVPSTWAKQTSSLSIAFSEPDDMQAIRKKMLMERLQQAQFLKKRMQELRRQSSANDSHNSNNAIHGYSSEKKKNESETKDRNGLSSHNNDIQTKSELLKSSGESTNSVFKNKKRRLDASKLVATPPPSFGRLDTDEEFLTVKRKRFSQDDMTVEYAATRIER